MEPADIEQFKARLLEERAQLQGLAATRADTSATVELDQSSVGRVSRIDALQQQAMAQGTRSRTEARLRLIEAALRRCETGEYGDCLTCEEPIDRRRLEFDPAAALCIRCAAAREG